MIRFDPATEEQLPALLKLDADASPWPWPEAALRRHLLRHQVLSAFEGSNLVGFLVAQLVLDETSLLHLVVSKAHQGQGIGTRMLTLWLKQLRAQGQQRCLLEVRETNAPALALYCKLGFTEVGRRSDYYAAGSNFEAAIVMAASLSDPCASQD